jgi:hypothetical protein
MQRGVKVCPSVFLCRVTERRVKIPFVIDPKRYGIMTERDVGRPVCGTFFKIPGQIHPGSVVPGNFSVTVKPATGKCA